MPYLPVVLSIPTPAQRLVASVVGVLLTLSVPSLPAQSLYDAGEPTPQEQQVLWLLNRARQDPTAEGVRVASYMRAHRIPADGVGHGPDQVAADFAAYAPQPPLAMNRALLAAARALTPPTWPPTACSAMSAVTAARPRAVTPRRAIRVP